MNKKQFGIFYKVPILVPFPPSNKLTEPVQQQCHIHRYSIEYNFTSTKDFFIQKACITVFVTTNATTSPSSIKDSFNFRIKTLFVRVHSMNRPVSAPTTAHVIEHVLSDYKRYGISNKMHLQIYLDSASQCNKVNNKLRVKTIHAVIYGRTATSGFSSVN